MASKLLVNELQAATGTDITITAGHSLVAAASVFKIAGGIAGQALITDGAVIYHLVLFHLYQHNQGKQASF